MKHSLKARSVEVESVLDGLGRIVTGRSSTGFGRFDERGSVRETHLDHVEWKIADFVQ